VRCFVAAELPDDVRGALAAWTPHDDALRPVDPAGLHVTLAFLGERPDEEAASAGAALAPLARPVGALSLGEALWLPRRRPRVLSLGVADGDGALGALQAAVVEALRVAIGFEPEGRAFLPHVTVARVRGGGGGRGGGRGGVPRRLLDAPPAPPPVGTFAAPAVTLMRSRLSPRGARYEPVARVEL
jgi:2'-5' RNA ligase